MLRILGTLLLPASLLAQSADESAAGSRLHPYLQSRVAAAAAGTRLPVYFVIGDRLPREHFFPRVLRMDVETRRATVVRELREHMERTQRDLVRYLEDQVQAGSAEIISRNYLGNFVRARATAQAILGGAAVDGVDEVWFDYEPTPEEVLDVGPAPAGPGNGPLDTKANLVWAQGITGQGVVWMNSDSGVRASHTNINSVHPGLAGRLWQNPGEVFNNGVDDDMNGKVDDFYGWDFGSNNNNIDDSGGHGTNVAGVFIGIDHNNQDVLGNCPDARIMTGQISGEASQWDTVQYAIDEGAHGQTSSHSYKNNFSPPPNYKMHRDVGETSLAAGLIRTNSTSNNGSSCNGPTVIRRPFNISAPGNLPPPWLHPDQTLVGNTGGVLGIGAHNVGSSTQPSYTPCGPFAWHLADVLAVLPLYPVANWDAVNDNDYPWQGGTLQGLLKPDLTGPTGTRTTSSSSGYSTFGGTSNATPSVSSCLALALSANTSLTPEDMAMAVQTTAIDYNATGKDNISGAGRVDAWELTKMARAIHRVNGDVSHTVEISVGSVPTLGLELDSIPNTPILLLLGTGTTNQVFGSFTLRVAVPVPAIAATTDAQGDYAFTIPAFPALAGLDAYTQFAVADPAFGPTTGSNAIHIRFVP